MIPGDGVVRKRCLGGAPGDLAGVLIGLASHSCCLRLSAGVSMGMFPGACDGTAGSMMVGGLMGDGLVGGGPMFGSSRTSGTKDVIFLRNLLFLAVSCLDPSILTKYMSKSQHLIITSVLSHFLGLFPD